MADRETPRDRINTYGAPSQLRITDLRLTEIESSSMRCILLKIETNQGLVGLGEVRDGASPSYAAMLKSRLVGENPCEVERLFRRIRQFGGPSRQGGGVSGIEIALWDLAGKAYQVPVYQMLGGRYRDTVPMYCDLGKTPMEQRANGTDKGRALLERMKRFGFTMGKITLSVEEIQGFFPDEPILSGPKRYLDQIIRTPEYRPATNAATGLMSVVDKPMSLRKEDYNWIMAPNNLMHVTEHGLDRYEEHLRAVRDVIGWQTPLAIDHLGHLELDDMKRLLQRLEKYNLMWVEDVMPCTMPDAYRELRRATSTPLACGEDLTYVENFEPLCQSGGVAVVHPDICSAGGIAESKKIGDMAQKHHVAMAMHMCETPVAALATGHVGLCTENFAAMEFNAPDDPDWQQLVTGLKQPLIQEGSFVVPEQPGLGADNFNDEVLKEHLWPNSGGLWQSTEQWDKERSYDRLWS